MHGMLDRHDLNKQDIRGGLLAAAMASAAEQDENMCMRLCVAQSAEFCVCL